MKRLVLVGALASALAATTAFAQTGRANGNNLGTVHIARKVMADGKPLPAGTYNVRATDEAPQPATGQDPNGEKYVEFLKGGKVVGREVATVVPSAEISKIAKEKPPAAGASRAELLKGGDYYRVWINKGGTHYIINLATGEGKA
ncbi:MAG TPA: hypothetical protein VFB07_06835 [Vicinamibacterales bacterium]|nr:hypothetical protein [Vicinamibacterales bacterium]